MKFNLEVDAPDVSKSGAEATVKVLSVKANDGGYLKFFDQFPPNFKATYSTVRLEHGYQSTLHFPTAVSWLYSS